MSTPSDESTTTSDGPPPGGDPPRGATGAVPPERPVPAPAAASRSRRSLRASGVVVAMVGATLLAAVVADFQWAGPYGYGRVSDGKVWFALLVFPWVLTVAAGALMMRTKRLGQVVAGAVVGFGVMVVAVAVAAAVAGDRVAGTRFVIRISRLSPYLLHTGLQLSTTQAVRYACASAVMGAVFGFVVIVVATGFERSWFPALGGAFAGALLLGPQPLITHTAKHAYTNSLGVAGALVVLGIAAVAAALDAPQPAARTVDVTNASTLAAGRQGAPTGGSGLTPTNAFAVVALVLGLLGGNLLAVIFGHLGRRQIRETGERGDGMALAGLILGYVGIVLWAVLFVAALANS
ncbi:MAG TPA: DUF4190 domain-containing protein [Acidimicrobiales bacterium]|nr:DUF4190 domain-containing protein [Acidimicrobiales bacterium]